MIKGKYEVVQSITSPDCKTCAIPTADRNNFSHHSVIHGRIIICQWLYESLIGGQLQLALHRIIQCGHFFWQRLYKYFRPGINKSIPSQITVDCRSVHLLLGGGREILVQGVVIFSAERGGIIIFWDTLCGSTPRPPTLHCYLYNVILVSSTTVEKVGRQ